MEDCCRSCLGHVPQYFGDIPIYRHAQPMALNLCINSHNKTYPPLLFPPVYPLNQPSSVCTSSASISSTTSSSDDVLHKSEDTVKSRRPFKIFSKDPLQLAVLAGNSDKRSLEAYLDFRNKMLPQDQPSNRVCETMRRSYPCASERTTDPEYLEKRRKNNESARRSREARKTRAEEMAVRCAFLEQENMSLKIRLSTLESERKHLLSRVGYV